MKLIPKYQLGNKLDLLANRFEKAADILNVGADTLGLGMAATGVGAPVAPVISLIGSIPSAIIDGYQAGKALYNKDYNSAAKNGAEFLLDLVGPGISKKVAKTVGETSKRAVEISSLAKRKGKSSRLYKQELSQAQKAKQDIINQKINPMLAKRGVRPSDGQYYKNKVQQAWNNYNKPKIMPVPKPFILGGTYLGGTILPFISRYGQ